MHILSTCAVLGVIAVLAPTSIAAATDVHIDESGGVIVPVTIDGSGPFRFLLDTGATHSVVSQSLAGRLSLRAVARTAVLTSTGREWRRVVELNQTAIQAARSERLLASEVTQAQLDAIAHGIDGIIGQDFLFAFNYTLDYRRRRLTWGEGDDAHADVTRIPLIAQGGRYLVQLESHRNAGPLLLVPDSGASGFVAYERNGRTKLALTHAGANMNVQSLSGLQHVRTMMLRTLRLGTLTLKDYPVAVVPRNPDDAVEGDGLLPLHLFASVTFNAREGYLILRGGGDGGRNMLAIMSEPRLAQ